MILDKIDSVLRRPIFKLFIGLYIAAILLFFVQRFFHLKYEPLEILPIKQEKIFTNELIKITDEVESIEISLSNRIQDIEATYKISVDELNKIASLLKASDIKNLS